MASFFWTIETTPLSSSSVLNLRIATMSIERNVIILIGAQTRMVPARRVKHTTPAALAQECEGSRCSLEDCGGPLRDDLVYNQMQKQCKTQV